MEKNHSNFLREFYNFYYNLHNPIDTQGTVWNKIMSDYILSIYGMSDENTEKN